MDCIHISFLLSKDKNLSKKAQGSSDPIHVLKNHTSMIQSKQSSLSLIMEQEWNEKCWTIYSFLKKLLLQEKIRCFQFPWGTQTNRKARLWNNSLRLRLYSLVVGSFANTQAGTPSWPPPSHTRLPNKREFIVMTNGDTFFQYNKTVRGQSRWHHRSTD